MIIIGQAEKNLGEPPGLVPSNDKGQVQSPVNVLERDMF